MESKRNLKKYDVMAVIIIFLNIIVFFIDIFFNNRSLLIVLVTAFKYNAINFLTLTFIIIDFVTIGYFLFRLIIKIKYKLSYGYKNMDIKYVRDDLNKMNPSYLCYLLNMDLDVNKCINSTLLKLTCDGYLRLENNSFVYTDKNIEYLSNSEKMLILSIKKECEDSKEKFHERYRYSIVGELLKKSYIKEVKNPFLILISKIFAVLFFCFLIFIMFMFLFLKEKMFDIFGLILIIFLFSGILITIITEYIMKKNNIGFDLNYKKTEKTKKVVEEMLSLKAFLKDFSNIKNKTLEELGLQQYYFVYSIIFDLNNDENKRIEILKNNSLCFKEK